MASFIKKVSRLYFYTIQNYHRSKQQHYQHRIQIKTDNDLWQLQTAVTLTIKKNSNKISKVKTK